MRTATGECGDQPCSNSMHRDAGPCATDASSSCTISWKALQMLSGPALNSSPRPRRPQNRVLPTLSDAVFSWSENGRHEFPYQYCRMIHKYAIFGDDYGRVGKTERTSLERDRSILLNGSAEWSHRDVMKCDGRQTRHQPDRRDRLAGRLAGLVSSRPVSTLQVRRQKHGPSLLNSDNAFCGLGAIQTASIIAQDTIHTFALEPRSVERNDGVDRSSRARQLGFLYRYHVGAPAMETCSHIVHCSLRLSLRSHFDLSAAVSLDTEGKVAQHRVLDDSLFPRDIVRIFIYSSSWRGEVRRRLHRPYSLKSLLHSTCLRPWDFVSPLSCSVIPLIFATHWVPGYRGNGRVCHRFSLWQYERARGILVTPSSPL